MKFDKHFNAPEIHSNLHLKFQVHSTRGTIPSSEIINQLSDHEHWITPKRPPNPHINQLPESISTSVR